jgi:ornithine cyclodeaminase
LAKFKTSFAKHWPDLADRTETTIDARAVREADVICTATTSKTPVFDDADVPDGVHINGVGSYSPDMQEIPSQTVVRARVVVDSFDAAFAEAGDLIEPVQAGLISQDRLRTELGHLVAGTSIGRQDPQEITFFKSVGNAIQDVIVARQVVTRAIERGLGLEFDLHAE